MKNVEMALENVDFSRFSKVRDSLKERLMNEYDTIRGNSQSISILCEELSDDELDMVVAAGASPIYKTDSIKPIPHL